MFSKGVYNWLELADSSLLWCSKCLTGKYKKHGIFKGYFFSPIGFSLTKWLIQIKTFDILVQEYYMFSTVS